MTRVKKIAEGHPNLIDYLKNERCAADSEYAQRQGSSNRRRARSALLRVQHGVPCITTLAAAEAAVRAMEATRDATLEVESLQRRYAQTSWRIDFVRIAHRSDGEIHDRLVPRPNRTGSPSQFESEPTSKSIRVRRFQAAGRRQRGAHARAMTESLEKVGYRCEVATSGPEAARLIERETYDIIITDMVMNDVDGMKILKLATRTVARVRSGDGDRARDRAHRRRGDATGCVQFPRKADHAQSVAGDRRKSGRSGCAQARKTPNCCSGSTNGSDSKGSSTPARRCKRSSTGCGGLRRPMRRS